MGKSRHRRNAIEPHRCDCGELCYCRPGSDPNGACVHECGEPTCPDCLDPWCDGWCADALANEYGVDVHDAGF